MTSLRSLVGSGRTLVAPGATDALSAKLIEAHGFDCVGEFKTGQLPGGQQALENFLASR